MGTEKSHPEGPPLQWETRLCRVSHWNGGPEGWDFQVPLHTKDGFNFSHIYLKHNFTIHLARHCGLPLATYSKAL